LKSWSCKQKNLRATGLVRSIQYALYSRLSAESISVNLPNINQSELGECLSSLEFQEMGFRVSEIDVPYPDTGEWLFADERYLEWIERRNSATHQGLLWIKGSPGAGKSTLMKEAFRRAHLPSRDLVAAFFFHARGNVELQTTPLGLFRSLWYQLLSQDRDLQAAFISAAHQKYTRWDKQNKSLDGRKMNWNERELKDLFREFLTVHKKRILLFVDGLDECVEAKTRDLVKFFRQTTKMAHSQGASLSICLSSRHYPLITVDCCPEIIVERRNSEDISLFIAAELLTGEESATYEQIRQEMVQKAKGIFLWVVLVVRVLWEDSDAGKACNTRWIQQRLRSVPAPLEELFQDLFKSVQPSDLQATVFLIQMVLLAVQPVRLQELCQYLGLRLEAYKSLKDWRKSMTYTNDMKAFERRIKFLSRGLIEVTPVGTAQFIHESVRDFFLNHDGLALLDNTLESDAIGKSHCSIITVCLDYLAIKELARFDDIDASKVQVVSRRRNKESIHLGASNIYDDIWDAPESFPFLWYVAKCLFRQFLQAERAGTTHIPALQRLLEPGSQLWKRFKDSNVLCETNPFNDPPLYPTTVLYAFIVVGLVDCARALIINGANVNDEGGSGSGHFPILAAAKTNETSLLGLLIESGARIDVVDRSKMTVLHHCAMHNNLAAVRKVVSLGLNVNSKDRYIQTALHHSLIRSATQTSPDKLSLIESSRTEVAEFLVENGADINSRDFNGQTPLLCAIKGNNMAHAALLLQHKADPNTQDNYGYPLLHMAIHQQNADIVNLLLDYGADDNACDRHGLTAAQLANAQIIPVDLFANVTYGISEAITLWERKGAKELTWRDKEESGVKEVWRKIHEDAGGKEEEMCEEDAGGEEEEIIRGEDYEIREIPGYFLSNMIGKPLFKDDNASNNTINSTGAVYEMTNGSSTPRQSSEERILCDGPTWEESC
jgi:Ankyrin repeats (many copies)/NACHT domain